MKRLVLVKSETDIFEKYRNTPVQALFEYHNLGFSAEPVEKAQMLISLCMDNRKKLNIPENFAYILRSGGASLRNSEFKVSFAIGVGDISTIVLIAHNNCRMVNLNSQKQQFIEGLVRNAGWDKKLAEEHFDRFAPIFEIENEIDFVLNETKRLRLKYPKILIAPIFYNLKDNLLYLIEE